MIVRKRFHGGKDGKEAVSSQPSIDETTFDAGNLTLDLVEDILCRLSVNLLMQLRCVCKSWNSLISDPIFAKKHLHGSQKLFNRCHLIFCPKDGMSKFWDSQLPSIFNSASTSISMKQLCFPRNIQDGSYQLNGSCDGILCFSTGISNNCVILWNPSIRKSKELPPLKNQPELEPRWVKSHTIYGFGHDRVTDNYKVVAFCCHEGIDSFNWVCKKVQVHTLGKETWKTIGGVPFSFPFSYGFTLTKCGIFLSGAVNWLGVTFSPDNMWPSQVIFSFDLGNESYQEFLPPDYGEVEVDVLAMNLGVMRDCLCIFCRTWFCIHVWLMEDYGNKDSWTKLFVVTYDYSLFCLYDIGICPLYILEDEQLLWDFKVMLAVYNYRNRTLKLLNFEPGEQWFNNHIYIESLVSPLHY